MFISLFLGCSENSFNDEFEKSITWEDLEIEFNMKNSFSQTSKDGIINKYSSLQSYLDLANIRKSELSKKVFPKNIDYFQVNVYNDNEGIDETFSCPDNYPILDRAEELGIELPFSDRAGLSSTCAAKLIHGVIDQSENAFLDDDQLDDGFILLCVAYPLANSVILTHQEENL